MTKNISSLQVYASWKKNNSVYSAVTNIFLQTLFFCGFQSIANPKIWIFIVMYAGNVAYKNLKFMNLMST